MASNPARGMPIDDDKVRMMKMFPKSDDFAVLLGKLPACHVPYSGTSLRFQQGGKLTYASKGFRNSRIGTPPARTEQHKVDILNLLYVGLAAAALSAALYLSILRSPLY